VDVVAVTPVDGPLDAVVHLPGSKSLTNRALVCAALARGRSIVEGVLLADDTEAMLDGLRRLGIGMVVDHVGERVAIDGCGGVLPGAAVGARLDARLSGTTSRFLLPVLALGPGPARLDGAAPLRDRPMADGIAAVRRLGAEVVEEARPGHLPVTVRGGAPPSSDGPVDLAVRGDASSQFLSGLLMVGPVLAAGLRIRVAGRLVSGPYVDMTAAVMRDFGAVVTVEGAAPGDGGGGAEGGADSAGPARTWTVAATGYQAGTHRVEPDASAASYAFAAAAICGGRVTVAGLGKASRQGDLAFVDLLERMGCRVERGPSATTVERTGALAGIDVDLSDLSDTAPTLAAVAVHAGSPTRVRGVGFIRAKETDRIGNVVRELRRCGVAAVEEADGFVVHPGTPRPTRVETYQDHRMAMSFALLGLRTAGIEILDPGCVAKTFPGYWDMLEALRPAGG
jgi:3-phosphoshikimate 1-carboxyvinyltransferase